MASPGTSRLPLMAGNWKSHLNHNEAVVLVQRLAWTLRDKHHDPARSEVAVIPPFTDLRSVQTLVDGDRLPLSYGAQDVSAHDGGAHTGEVAASMLAALGCTYVLVGHSERREQHGEGDALVNAKVQRVLDAAMTPLVCVGEGLDVRQAGEHVAHCTAQLDGSLAGLSAEQVAGLVVAYEPVWAIGADQPAPTAHVRAVAEGLRQRLLPFPAARLIYGGTAGPGLFAELADATDGLFLGRRAHDPAALGQVLADVARA